MKKRKEPEAAFQLHHDPLAEELALEVIEKVTSGEDGGVELRDAFFDEEIGGPFLTSTATEAFEPGNVVTVEPGVYLPGRIGCRVEDTVLVTTDGAEVLSTAAE